MPRFRSMFFRWAAPLCALLALPSASMAQDPVADTGHDSEARGLFLAGQAAFEAGRFEEALEHFERAYALSERSELLYNVGLTAERLRHDERALEAYTLYLEQNPDAPHRANVEGRVRILREQIEARPDEPESAESVAAPEPMPEPDESSNALGWALTLGGGSLLLAGVVSLGLAVGSRNAADEAPDGTPWTTVEADVNRMERRRAFGIAFAAIGAAAAAVGLVLVSRGDADEEHVALRLGPGALTVEGSF